MLPPPARRDAHAHEKLRECALLDVELCAFHACDQSRICMDSRQIGPVLPLRCANLTRYAVALTLAVTTAALGHAAVPSSGTLSSTSGPIAWDGPNTGGAAPDGEPTCIEGTNCDTFTLKIAAGTYTGQRVRFKVTWTVAANDYDVYVHQGSNDGPIVGSSTGGAPSTAEENT